MKKTARDKHTLKPCSICGKTIGAHWARHWKRQHPGVPPSAWSVLKEGEDPVEPDFEPQTGKFEIGNKARASPSATTVDTTSEVEGRSLGEKTTHSGQFGLSAPNYVAADVNLTVGNFHAIAD